MPRAAAPAKASPRKRKTPTKTPTKRTPKPSAKASAKSPAKEVHIPKRRTGAVLHRLYLLPELSAIVTKKHKHTRSFPWSDVLAIIKSLKIKGPAPKLSLGDVVSFNEYRGGQSYVALPGKTGPMLTPTRGEYGTILPPAAKALGKPYYSKDSGLFEYVEWTWE